MSSVNEILEIVLADPIDIGKLETALNAADPQTRLDASRRFNLKIQKRLYAVTEGRVVTADQLVPIDAKGQQVIHDGTNTLPAFRAFQKRFAKPEDPANREVVGYNHNWYQFAAAPGYFVGSHVDELNQFVIDYTELPTEKAPEWPKIISNKFGLGIFIWTGMKDRMRSVSEHVTIGRAYKGGKPMNAYFTLVRQDP